MEWIDRRTQIGMNSVGLNNRTCKKQLNKKKEEENIQETMFIVWKLFKLNFAHKLYFRNNVKISK